MPLQNSPLPSNRNNSSQAAVSGLNLNLDPVQKFIFEGFQKRFLTVFGARSVWTTSTDKVQALKRLFSDGARSYPYAFLVLSSWTEATDRGNTNMHARYGHMVSVSSDQLRGYRMQLVPVDMQVTVEFITNDFKQVLNYATSWMLARRLGRLKFDVAYGMTHFGVSVVPSESIQFPMREADPDNVSEYLASADLVINGFVSDPTLIEQQIADTVQLDGKLQENLPAGTEVWSIRRSARREEMNNPPLSDS